jgi:uncharacterized repeat protein (TIGR02543 family)
MNKRLTNGIQKFLVITLLFVVCYILFSCENPMMIQILEAKTITFDSNGGSSVPSQNLIKGEYVKKPADPYKPDNVFSGWFQDNETFSLEWDFFTLPRADLTLYAKWKKIEKLTITVTGPMTGEIPVNEAKITGNYTVEKVSWSPDDEVFKGGTAYTVSVTVRKKDDMFTNLIEAAVNGNAALITDIDEYTVTVTCTFAPTSAKPISEILIKTQPGKLEYTHNDTLDLSGLVVTLTYEDDSSEDVPLANFAEKNIFTNPANGAFLSRSTHNGKPVVVSAGSHSVNADYLKINRASGANVDIPIVAGYFDQPGIYVSFPTGRLGNGQTIEYARNFSDFTSDDWQEDVGFFDLSAGIPYYIFARSKENEDYTVGVPAVSKKIIIFNVTFDTNNDTDKIERYIISDSRITNPPVLINSGYGLIGWYKNTDYTDQWNFENDIVTENITLYARWAAVRIGSGASAVYYQSLKDAIDDAPAGSANAPTVITLLADITAETGYSLANKHIKLTVDAQEQAVITASAGNFSLFTVNPGESLILDGHLTLNGNNEAAEATRRGLYSAGTLIMNKDVTTTGFNNSSTSSGGGCVYIWGGTFEMTGGTINGNNASGNNSNGGGLYIGVNGTFNMSGGEISGNTASGSNSNGGGVYLSGRNGSTANFTMNGGEITGNTTSGSGGGVYLYSDTGTANFTMNGGEITGNTATGNGGGVYLSVVDGTGKFIMSSGAIKDNEAESGGGVYADGEFTMSGGVIENNTAGENGGGVFSIGSPITMSGGTIKDNNAINGGGWYAAAGFNMINGAIEDNAAGSGGGVYVDTTDGNFTMSGGRINGNNAGSGGGVYVSYNAKFIMIDGNIDSNTTIEPFGTGGGVLIMMQGSFEMKGGKISGNIAPLSGGGVYVNAMGNFTMSGGSIYGTNAPTGYSPNISANGAAIHVQINGTAAYSNYGTGGNITTTNETLPQ